MQLTYKDFSTIGTKSHLQLDQQYVIVEKTINQKDPMLMGVEMDSRKSLKRKEFK